MFDYLDHDIPPHRAFRLKPGEQLVQTRRSLRRAVCIATTRLQLVSLPANFLAQTVEPERELQCLLPLTPPT